MKKIEKTFWRFKTLGTPESAPPLKKLSGGSGGSNALEHQNPRHHWENRLVVHYFKGAHLRDEVFDHNGKRKTRIENKKVKAKK